MFLIAGPCLLESEELIDRTASFLDSVASRFGVDVILKGSYRKANRTSIASVETVAGVDSIDWLVAAGRRHGMRTTTDFHSVEEIRKHGSRVDVVQIPAFLARQTDILLEAARSSAVVNVKKGQFMAPEDMAHAVDKIRSVNRDAAVWVTERGTTFGYHDLVVDMRSLVVMRGIGVPVIFDATHATQAPSIGSASGGDRTMAAPLARAAAAVGIDGLFFETHPDPERALSDRGTQLAQDDAVDLINQVLAVQGARDAIGAGI